MQQELMIRSDAQLFPREFEITNFWSKLIKTNECWLWGGYISKSGYGQTTITQRSHLVHQVAYDWYIGNIPPFFHVHHHCNNKNCANPKHLLLISGTAHGRLSGLEGKLGVHNSSKKECKHGHIFNENNTYFFPSGHRYCKTCHQQRKIKHKLKLKGEKCGL